jgi:hypothetical protein
MDEEIDNYNWRPEYPNVIMKTTLTLHSAKFNYISHWGMSHIAVILIFPRINRVNEWDLCIVHHPCQHEELAINYVLLILESSPSCGKYIQTCILHPRKRSRTM